MSPAARPVIREKDITGLKYFDQLAPLLERLHDDACQRDTAGNRTLHFDQYGLLMLLYFLVFIVSLFDWEWLYSESFRTIGLVVTLLAIVLAALSLTLDFGSIDAGVSAGAPKFMEWYSAYGLMVTLIWLYLLILRLLAILSRNR